MPKRFFIAIAIAVSASNASAAEYIVTQSRMAFKPDALTVKVGDTVVFKNNDKLTHNVYSKSSGNSFNLKAVRPGASENVTFSTPGEVKVRCAIHPKMKMKISVEK